MTVERFQKQQNYKEILPERQEGIVTKEEFVELFFDIQYSNHWHIPPFSKEYSLRLVRQLLEEMPVWMFCECP